MRILITRTDRIGDVAISTPAIRAVREKFKNAYIAFCVSPEAYDIVAENPHLDEVIVCEKKGNHKGLAGLFRFAAYLKKKEFDIALLLHPTQRMNLAVFLAGIPRRIGYDWKWGFFLTDKLKHTKQLGEKHEVDYTLDVVRRIGADTDDIKPYIFISDKVKSEAEELLKSAGLDNKKRLVAIHPFASCESKRWPANRFAELIRMLKAVTDIEIVLIGNDKNKSAVEEISKGCGRLFHDLTGKTSVRQMIGVLAKAALLISNDSGPVHVAVACGIPVISIFGRKDPGLSPRRWKPLGPKDIYFHRDAGCEKCLAHECNKGFVCLVRVGAKEVFEKAQELLKL